MNRVRPGQPVKPAPPVISKAGAPMGTTAGKHKKAGQ